MDWCKSTNENGETPSYLLYSTESGSVSAVDVIKRERICSVQLPTSDDVALSLTWSPNDPNIFLIGTNQGVLSILSIKPGVHLSNCFNCQLIESQTLKFSIDFLKFSPTNSNSFLVGSTNGYFILGNMTNSKSISFSTPIGHFPLSSGQKGNNYDDNYDDFIVTLDFFPYIQNTLVFSTQIHAYLYFCSEDQIIQFFSSEGFHEPIKGILFPETTSMNFLVLHTTHGRIFHFSENTISKRDYLKVSSLPKSSSKPLISGTTINGQILILSRGGSIAFYTEHKQKFWATSYFSWLSSKPTSCDVSPSNIIFGTAFGYIIGTGNYHKADHSNEVLSSDMTMYYSIFEGKITKVLSVSDQKCVALGIRKENDRYQQKAFFVDFTTRTCKSILRPAFEQIDTPLSLIISPLRSKFAIISESGVMIVFDNHGNETALIFEENGRKISAVFTDEDDIWSIDSAWGVRHLKILSTGYELAAKFYLNGTNGKPLCCSILPSEIIEPPNVNQNQNPDIQFSRYFIQNTKEILIITTAGEFILFNWQTGTCRVVMYKFEGVKSIIRNEYKLIVLEEEETAVIISLSQDPNEEIRMNIWRIKASVRNGVLVGSNAILARMINSKKISYLSSDTFLQISTPIATIFNNHPLLKPISERYEILTEFCKQNSAASQTKYLSCALKARDMGFSLLADLLSLNDQRFKSSTFYVNVLKSKALEEVKSILYLFSRSSSMRIKKMRYSLIADDDTKAAQFLLESLPDDPNFSSDVMKAVFCNYKGSLKSIKAVAAAFIDGGKVQDAIDILLLSKQNGDATRLLISEGECQFAFLINRSILDESEVEIISKEMIKTFISSNQKIQAASLLILLGKYKEAADVLSKDYPFIQKLLMLISAQNLNSSY